MQPTDEYVVSLLAHTGLITNEQIASARSRLNGASNVVDVLVRDGVVSSTDVSRTVAAQAQMDWVDLSMRLIPP
ncbi:MAG: hypothetical protein H0W04_10145, partial [Chthoniobacterales bacterium]|nr:hypothetical protein [Chthoniobacterales bacterium]